MKFQTEQLFRSFNDYSCRLKPRVKDSERKKQRGCYERTNEYGPYVRNSFHEIVIHKSVVWVFWGHKIGVGTLRKMFVPHAHPPSLYLMYLMHIYHSHFIPFFLSLHRIAKIIYKVGC